MTGTKLTLRQAIFALVLAIGSTAHADELTVVELFTSQGCSSCPPADALLAELAERDDVLALSTHVDYWDYLGWKDPFASAATTKRQRSYADKLGLRYVYTPQMVIQGTTQVVGSHRQEVLKEIAGISHTNDIDVDLHRQDDGVLVTLPADEAFARDRRAADVWLILIDDRRSTRVERGENRGRHLTYRNVVQSINRIGIWRGQPMTIGISVKLPADADACAVLVQGHASGRVLGAARMPPPS